MRHLRGVEAVAEYLPRPGVRDRRRFAGLRRGGAWALCAISLVALTAPGLEARTADVNGGPDAAPSPRRLLTQAQLVERLQQIDPEFPGWLEGGGIGCRVEDAFGNPVRTVNVLNQAGDPAFYLQYLSDGEVDQQVTFLVVPQFTGSPLGAQIQRFTPNDACSIVTPFGIPFWGLDLTSGPWVLAVRNDRGGVAFCPFEVVP